MKRTVRMVSLAVGLVVSTGTAAVATELRAFGRTICAPDAVLAGTICLDRYEASVWRVPDPTTTNASLVRKIRRGSATRADLAAGGAMQLGAAGDDYGPCRDDGQNCGGEIYALSLAAEMPSAFITWFQAQEACANSDKRLPTNAEWQIGVTGTPDPGPDDGRTDCNTGGNELTSLTASRRRCVSKRGAFDMVGNLQEWVSDWVAGSTFCPGWATFSNDIMCLAGASTTETFPGALVRGGSFVSLAHAGPVAVAVFPPSHSSILTGFRCAH